MISLLLFNMPPAERITSQKTARRSIAATRPTTFMLDVGERPQQRRKTAMALGFSFIVFVLYALTGAAPLGNRVVLLPPSVYQPHHLPDVYGLVFQARK